MQNYFFISFVLSLIVRGGLGSEQGEGIGREAVGAIKHISLKVFEALKDKGVNSQIESAFEQDSSQIKINKKG